MPSKKRNLLAASNAGDPIYVEDVFSPYLYTGAGAAQTITNGIDLAGKGGLVWLKSRSAANGHILFDTERGGGKYLQSSATDAEAGSVTYMDFLSTGFDFNGSYGWMNDLANELSSWTFRKQAGFFDVVTWTGDGIAGRTVAHNLGSAPACMIVKCTSDGSTEWFVYHKDLTSNNYHLRLDGTNAEISLTAAWNDTSPTSTAFTVGTDPRVNGSARTYVAYLFADDDQQFGAGSDESIIKCGSFTTDGSRYGSVDLGWEPQYVLYKDTSRAVSWQILDNMRGLGPSTPSGDQTGGGASRLLYTDAASAETGGTAAINSQGFTTGATDVAGDTYIYMAIRRPMKVPEAGTEVFAIDTRQATNPGFVSGFPVDFVLARESMVGTSNNGAYSRLTGTGELFTNSTAAEAANARSLFDSMTGWYNTNGADTDRHAWMFKRAPEFMDIVAYTSTGVTGRTVAHGLSVAPEFWVVKCRSNSGYAWKVGSTPMGNTQAMDMQGSGGMYTDASWNNTDPSTSVLTLGANASVNTNNYTYIAYLFATLAGVSKVGSYTADALAQTIDCGFSAGARFVLIKRTDASGDWYMYDTERGIIAGDDPYLLLNSTAAEVTNTDFIDPHVSGFALPAGSSVINIDGGEYIFLAIA